MIVLMWERIVPFIYGGSNAFRKYKKCFIFPVDDNNSVILIYLSFSIKSTILQCARYLDIVFCSACHDNNVIYH